MATTSLRTTATSHARRTTADGLAPVSDGVRVWGEAHVVQSQSIALLSILLYCSNMTSHTNHERFIIEGQAPREEMDALMQLAVELGLRIYCPLELPALEYAGLLEKEPQDWISRADLIDFAERAGTFNPSSRLPERAYSRLLCRHEDGVLTYRNDEIIEATDGARYRTSGDVEFNSLARLVRNMDADIESGLRSEKAIAKHLGNLVGTAIAGFLRGFAQDRLARRQNQE